MASLDERINPSEDTDTGIIDAQAGARYEFARSSLTASFQGQRFEVDNNLFRSVTGGNVQWQTEINSRNRLSVFGQLAELDYHPDAQNVRDALLQLAGVAWAHAFEGKGSPNMFLSAYVAVEDERSSATFDNAFLGRKYFGFRVGGDYQLKSNLQLNGVALAQFSDYGGTDPSFLRSRDDELYQLTAGLTYQPSKAWTVRPQIRYTRNQSNLALHDYQRISAFATVRYTYR